MTTPTTHGDDLSAGTDPSSGTHPTPGNGAGRGPVRRWLGLGLKAIVALIVAGSFAVWAYAFSGRAERRAPDLLDEPAFAQQAETICAAAMTDLAALPNALDAEDGPERADQIRLTTARLEQMLADLEAAASGTSRDLAIIGSWIDDWRVMVADRYRYADAIAENPSAQFLITDTGVGERIDRRITRMAETNSMRSCEVPGDV